MKYLWKRWSIAGALAVFLALAAIGCGKDEEASDEVGSAVYPVSIDNTEIHVGETTVQTLLDQGLRVTISDTASGNEYEIDPEVKLEANSYYSGGTVWITDQVFLHISMVTPEENAVKTGDAVIAYMEFSLAGEDAEGLDRLMFDGVPVSEFTREKAGELFPEFTGDENVWFSPASMTDYNYFTAYDSDGKMTKFSVEKKYDVEWDNEN